LEIILQVFILFFFIMQLVCTWIIL